MAEGCPGPASDRLRRVRKDMGLSHAQFFHSVRPLLAGFEHSLHDDGVTIALSPGRVRIRLGPEARRPLGGMNLPRTPVELVFSHCTADQVEAFLKRFDAVFRRGGG